MKNSFLAITSIVVAAHTMSMAAERPNIVLIMADDLGWGDTGYNGNKIIKTPHLDKMAAEGLQMNRFYSASAVCSPTRASVLTGRNPNRVGVPNANAGFLRPEEIALPEILKEAGYATGHFGKWHLGTLTHTERDANRGKAGNMKDFNPPKLHGYDVAFVTESKVPTYDPMKLPVSFQDKESKKLGWLPIEADEPFKPYGTYYWDIEGKKITDNLNGDDSRVIMDRVLPFIDQAVAKQTPFLSVIWFHAPHLPCVAGAEYQKMYQDQPAHLRNYAGCITALDEQIGRLRKHLKSKGIADNTMIWFCSDNGPESADRPDNGSAGPFRGRKRDLYEGGVRVPGLLVWPSKITTGRVTESPCITSDYLPTVLDVLDIQHPKPDYALDGISLLPLIEGKTKERSSGLGFIYRGEVSYSNDQYKLVSYGGKKFELYDLLSDPSETKDVSAQFPEINKELQKEFSAWSDSVKASFHGEEYGTESLTRSGLKWRDPMKSKKVKKGPKGPRKARKSKGVKKSK
jgi:arylsulfatase A-like enzyme